MMRVAFAVTMSTMMMASPSAIAGQPVTAPAIDRILAARGAPVDESYRQAFVACDGDAPGGVGRDRFLGHSLVRPGQPAARQYYLCSRDPSHVTLLDRRADGAIRWRSKMALDVDGSWISWAGRPGTTDLKYTSYTWPDIADRRSRAAQLDPDTVPFVVIPTDGLKSLTGPAASRLGSRFARTTGIGMGDMGVVIYGDRWTPVIVGDGGPFMRLGEGSARVFEEIGQSRCRRWAGTRCVGTGSGYPYRNRGIGSGVTFIIVPGSAQRDITAATAKTRLCSFARERFGLTGSGYCA